MQLKRRWYKLCEERNVDVCVIREESIITGRRTREIRALPRDTVEQFVINNWEWAIQRIVARAMNQQPRHYR
jgi:hypothetical protein